PIGPWSGMVGNHRRARQTPIGWVWRALEGDSILAFRQQNAERASGDFAKRQLPGDGDDFLRLQHIAIQAIRKM
ncbi:MAG: hypothetical protein WCK05_07110, partial [Planctomycetota bacterium]